MKVNYRGFEIDVKRERALGGWDNLYFSIIRLSDGYIMEDSFTTGDDTVREYIGYMKERIDAEIAEFPGWLTDEVPEWY